mmetsp:Transcript_28324/g.40581  ORF Transcript_28324/g.40581 Transcript_28324/m.40581 type:complete len:194 (-) Transcript_28324:423-1004(-)
MQNKFIYDSLQANKSTFFAKILYSIDAAVQTHLESCMMSDDRIDVDDGCLDFNNDQTAVCCRQFACSLPPTILKKLTNPEKVIHNDDDDDNDSASKRLKKKRRGNEDIDDKVFKNNSPTRAWLLHKDEKFGKVFHKHIASCPKDGEQPICLRFWIKGSCFKNCKNIHGKISQDARSAFDDWVKSCRLNSKPDF